MNTKTIRNCPFDLFDIEMLLLKLTIRSAILSKNAVGYRDRILLIPPNKEPAQFSIYRTSDPTSAIFVAGKRPSAAVDQFILSFVYEQDVNLNDVRFYLDSQADQGAKTWEYIKTHVLGVQNLINSSNFSAVLRGVENGKPNEDASKISQ